MYELKKMERYLRVNLLGPGPRLMKKEFNGPRSHKGWETLVWSIYTIVRTGKPICLAKTLHQCHSIRSHVDRSRDRTWGSAVSGFCLTAWARFEE